MIQPINTASSTKAINPPISGQYMVETYKTSEPDSGCLPPPGRRTLPSIRVWGAEGALGVQRDLLVR